MNKTLSKRFIINLDDDKLKALDAYCSRLWVSRTAFIKWLVNDWFWSNKKEIKTKLLQHVLYLDEYRESPMYVKHMQEILKEKTINAIPYKEQEDLKVAADAFAQAGEWDFALLLKDLSHWQRYLAKHSEQPKTFLEYVERKYSNEALRTY